MVVDAETGLGGFTFLLTSWRSWSGGVLPRMPYYAASKETGSSSSHRSPSE